MLGLKASGAVSTVRGTDWVASMAAIAADCYESNTEQPQQNYRHRKLTDSQSKVESEGKQVQCTNR